MKKPKPPMLANPPELRQQPFEEVELLLTAEQGTYFLKRSLMQTWPAKMGAKNFNDGIRSSIIHDDLPALKEALRPYSPFAQRRENRVFIFGPEELWKRDKDGNPTGEIAKPDKKVKVKLSKLAQNGIYWLLLYAASPSSPLAAETTDRPGMPKRNELPSMERVIWPIAAALGYTRQLRKDIGLKADRPTIILKDDDPEWEKLEKRAADEQLDEGAQE